MYLYDILSFISFKYMFILLFLMIHIFYDVERTKHLLDLSTKFTSISTSYDPPITRKNRDGNNPH